MPTDPNPVDVDLGLVGQVARSDIGTYRSDKVKSLGDEEKLWLIKNVSRPNSSFKYPHRVEYGKNHTLQTTWLFQFPWLCYSEAQNGGYCINCALFARSCMPLGQLITSPMTNFTHAKVTLQEHDQQRTHKAASMSVVDFVRYMEKGSLSVQQQLQSQSRALVDRNMVVLKSILKTIVFCGKQMIPLRGHCEHDESSDTNPGNFLALMDFRKVAGDSVLENHFETAPRNARYHSPQIPNDLILCTGDWIRTQILEEVKFAKYFAIMCR